jgi:hypothetical protein
VSFAYEHNLPFSLPLWLANTGVPREEKTMEWGSAEKNTDGMVKIPGRWLYLYYYEALNILFRFENALRVFVYVILKCELGKDWDLAALGESTIRGETKKRISQAREHGYLGYDVTSPVLFLNSGELIDIIAAEAYWKHFSPYFKAKKNVIQTKLQEIGTVRNSLAHFRPIKQDDVELIKQNAKHILVEIEKCLSQVIAVNNIVPTNSEESWYKVLKPIGSKQLTLQLFFSGDQEWVRIALTYEMPTLTKMMYGERYCSYKLANLRTPQVLQLYPAIRENCIYVSESSVRGSFRDGGEISAEKVVSIVFAKKNIEKSHAVIGDALRDLTLSIEKETALVVEDNLARGQLIEPFSGSANLTQSESSSYWRFNMDSATADVADVEHVEYWGKRMQYEDDFIATASSYPWMPAHVCEPSWHEL